MSINIGFVAEREIITPAGVKDIQRLYIDGVWQTPTEVTKRIYQSRNPIRVYVSWVLSVAEDVLEPVYADDDLFCEKAPVGVRKVNYGKQHVCEFMKEVALLKKLGFTVKPVMV